MQLPRGALPALELLAEPLRLRLCGRPVPVVLRDFSERRRGDFPARSASISAWSAFTSADSAVGAAASMFRTKTAASLHSAKRPGATVLVVPCGSTRVDALPSQPATGQGEHQVTGKLIQLRSRPSKDDKSHIDSHWYL